MNRYFYCEGIMRGAVCKETKEERKTKGEKMKMKKYEEKRRQIAGVMALIIMVSSLLGNAVGMTAYAAEGEYPYMMFASSGDEGAITLTTNNVGINGNVATNGSIVTSSQNVNINGTRTENLGNPEAYIGMPDIGEALEAAYFSANTEVLSEDYSLEDTNININTPLEGEGSIELIGNITLNAGVMAESDLVFSGEVKNTGDVVIYSATGDVVIESTNVNVNGLIYAPHGEIRINSMNLNMNNVILIAEKITIEANGINGGKNRAMAAFIGEDYAVFGDESGDDAGAGDNPSVSENEGENGNDPSVSENEGNVSDNTTSDNEDVMEGIVQMESAIEGEEIGQIYFKAISSEDEITVTPEGLPCVKNQMLLMANDSITFSQVESYVNEIGAVIVGYMEVTNDYQIEFLAETDVSEIALHIETIKQEPWADVIGYNLLWLEEPAFSTTDPWHAGDAGFAWDSAHPEGSNWGIEAVDYTGGLINAGVITSTVSTSGDIVTDHLTPVRMGIIDNAFDEWNTDLDDNILDVWNNFPTLTDLQAEYATNERLDHGTHVLGIMAAEFNNGTGIAGICVENEVLAYSLDGEPEDLNWNTDIHKKHHTFEIECALSWMIEQDVRVINYSYHMSGVSFAASQTGDGDAAIRRNSATDYLQQQSAYIIAFLDRMISRGYDDFLIVSIAGNANTEVFYKCDTSMSSGGYISVSSYENSNEQNNENRVENGMTYGSPSSSASVNNMDYACAEFSSVFNYITPNYACYDRIICVGSLQRPTYDSHNQPVYRIAAHTCSGNRVDILAPGTNIYSQTITGVSTNDCVSKNGTSMAAPFVSGAIGLVYNVCPDISAVEVKELIISSGSNYGLGVPVLNVADLIEEAILLQERKSMCEVQFHVTDVSGNVVSGANIEIRYHDVQYTDYFGGVRVEDGIMNECVYRNLRTDSGGNVTAYLPEGRYYALVTLGEEAGKIYAFRVTSQEIQTVVLKEITIETFSTDVQRRGIQARRIIPNVELNGVSITVYEGRNQTTGTPVHTDTTVREGLVGMLLPEGIYTVVASDGTTTKYFNIIINGDYTCYTVRF